MAWTTFAILAVMGHYFAYSFLLLEFVFSKPVLKNVIRAVTDPWQLLYLTLIVGFIVRRTTNM